MSIACPNPSRLAPRNHSQTLMARGRLGFALMRLNSHPRS